MKTKELKYVIVKVDFGREKAILFDKELVHVNMYNDISQIVSAGFCQLKFDDRADNGLIIEAYGESTSLKLKSREIDPSIIYMSLLPGLWDYHIEPDDPIANHIQELIDNEAKR